MKFIGGIILALFLCQQLLSQPIFETKNKEVIVKQKVESQTNWDYNFNKGKPSPKGILTSYTRYNSRGDIEEYVTYKMKDTLTYETFDYDQQGKRIDYTKHKGGKKNISYQKISKYDDKGNLISENGFDGTEKFRNNYHYNDQGKLSDINYYIENTLSEKRIFQYNGDTAQVTILNSSDIVTSYMSLKYDDNGNMLEETIYDANKNLLETRIFVYNSESKVISEVKYLQGNFSYKLAYLYDTRGELINIDEENLENSRYIKKNFKYNDNGFLIEMNWRRKPDEDFNKRNYTYDGNGLCTQVLTYYPSTDFKILTKYEYEFY
jgi:hypothetical protein